MKRAFYWVARLVKGGKVFDKNGVSEFEGEFDFVEVSDELAKENGIPSKDVIVTFWAETNSVMMGKFGRKIR